MSRLDHITEEAARVQAEREQIERSKLAAPEVQAILSAVTAITNEAESIGALEGIFERMETTRLKYYNDLNPLFEEYHQDFLGLLDENLDDIEEALDDFPEEEDEERLNEQKEVILTIKQEIIEAWNEWVELNQKFTTADKLPIGARVHLYHQYLNNATWLLNACLINGRIIENPENDDFTQKATSIKASALGFFKGYNLALEKWAEKQFQFSNKEKLRDKHIVLVEEAKSHKDLLAKLLETAGARVTHIKSSLQAERYLQEKPDIILATGSIFDELEYDSPGNASAPIVRSIQDRFPGQSTPVIAYENFRVNPENQAELQALSEQEDSPNLFDFKAFNQLLNQALAE